MDQCMCKGKYVYAKKSNMWVQKMGIKNAGVKSNRILVENID